MSGRMYQGRRASSPRGPWPQGEDACRNWRTVRMSSTIPREELGMSSALPRKRGASAGGA
eukprot:381789-Pyramimonas_sp.AAC.1